MVVAQQYDHVFSIGAFGEAGEPAQVSRRQSSAIEVSPRRPSSTMRIFSSAAWCFRVARRMLRTSVSDDAVERPDRAVRLQDGISGSGARVPPAIMIPR